jgi:predicted MFS family arabinose efflux permease
MLRLLLFGCWLSFFNGLFETPQNMFPKALGLGVWVMLWLKTTTRVGQIAVGPWAGRLADRLGNRTVMIGSLMLVAQAPLFYFLASPQRPWWVIGAWVMWIGWVGLNIGQPNLMLKLAPRQTNTPYIALWFTATGLFYAASTILGGMLLDRYSGASFTWLGRWVLDYYQTAFLLSWIFRSLGVLVLLLVVEPRDSG